MRLKTKLVLIITGLVFLLVSIVSFLYLSLSLQQNVDQNYLSSDIVAHQVLFATRQAIEEGVREHGINPAAGREELREQLSHVLSSDDGLSALLDSVISYSPTVYDITIADSQGRVLLSTDPALASRSLPYRPKYATLRFRSPFKVIGVVTGHPRVYDVPVMLERNGQPFATVHVGIRTTFLLQVFRPWLLETFTFIGASILTSLVLAALVANLALSPIEQISKRLDALSHDKAEDQGHAPARDAVVQVSNKIERIGQRMRNVEEVFSALKENLDSILLNLQDGVMLFTRDLRVVLVSSSVERFLGTDREQLLGASVTEIFDRNTILGALVLDAFDRGASIPQAEVKTETGRRLEIGLELIQNQRDAGRSAKADETLGALLTMHDLESVREIEDELEISHRLAAIGRLTSGVGHEVKNPINAIVVHLELMRTKLSGDEAPALRHLNVIQSEIQRLDRVVQTLVDFSRPVEPRMQEQDLRQVVTSVLQLASAELATRAVTVVSQLPERSVTVKVDTDMMRQALLNIVLNGAQAMPHGGNLILDLAEDARFAVLTVRDEGEGIPPEVLPRIFDLYFTTRKNGSGIGLSMTYRIVQLHSGVVDVASEVGSGTAFTIRIPSSHGSAESRHRGGQGTQTAAAGAVGMQGVRAQ